MRLKIPMSFVRFCLMGGVNLGINMGLTAFLHEIMKASEELAFAVALATIFAINFFTSRHFVFESAAKGQPVHQLFRYLLSSATFRLLEYAGFLLLHSVLGVYYLAAGIAVHSVAFVGKFLFYRAFVFVGPPATDPVQDSAPGPGPASK